MSARLQAVRTAAVLVLVAVVLLGALVAWLLGPGEVQPAMASFVDGVAGSTTALGATAKALSPILLIGSSALLAFRAGLWDVGQVGQFIAGGVCAGAVAPVMPGPGPVVILGSLAAGMLGGALWSTVISQLTRWTGLSLIVVSLVANYLATGLAGLVTRTLLQDPSSYDVTQTRPVPVRAWLPILLPRTAAHAGVLVSLAVFCAVALAVGRTAVGHKLLMIGRNPKAAALSGADTATFQLRLLALTGALCGAAGALEVLGVYHSYQDGALSGSNSIAWTGLTAALLVPRGVAGLLFSSALLAALTTGFAGLQRDLGISSGLGMVMQGAVVIAAAFTARTGRPGERPRRAPTPSTTTDGQREETA